MSVVIYQHACKSMSKFLFWVKILVSKMEAVLFIRSLASKLMLFYSVSEYIVGREKTSRSKCIFSLHFNQRNRFLNKIVNIVLQIITESQISFYFLCRLLSKEKIFDFCILSIIVFCLLKKHQAILAKGKVIQPSLIWGNQPSQNNSWE